MGAHRMELDMRAGINVVISFLVGLAGAQAIFEALDVDHRIAHPGLFVVYVGVALGLFKLTNWLLERLPYFGNKGGV